MLRFPKGGIHPFSKKEHTRRKPLLALDPAPKRIVLPLRSPNGAQVSPLVSSGDHVNRGELIAVPSNELAVPLYSGISGKVLEIAHHPHPLFQYTKSIILENDFQGTQEEHTAYQDYQSLSQEQLIARIKDLGIRNTDPQEYPVFRNIMEGRGKVDHLIINGCEDEPYLSSDHRLLLERQDLLVEGAKILAYTMGIPKISFAIQGDKLDAIESLEKTMGWDRKLMSIRTLPTGYPLGNDKTVICFVTGKELPPEKPPHYAHCAIFPAGTAFAVGEGVLRGVPQTHRAITVAGSAVKRPRNFWLPIGTPLDILLHNVQCVAPEKLSLLLLGGPMKGVPQTDFRSPILLGSSAVLAFATDDIPPHLLQDAPPSQVCIRCGHCLKVCPMHLAPSLLYSTMCQNQDLEEKCQSLQELHATTCISCGSCNYRCPARLPLAQKISEAKALLAPQGEDSPVPDDVKIYTPPESPQEVPQ